MVFYIDLEVRIHYSEEKASILRHSPDSLRLSLLRKDLDILKMVHPKSKVVEWREPKSIYFSWLTYSGSTLCRQVHGVVNSADSGLKASLGIRNMLVVERKAKLSPSVLMRIRAGDEPDELVKAARLPNPPSDLRAFRAAPQSPESVRSSHQSQLSTPRLQSSPDLRSNRSFAAHSSGEYGRSGSPSAASKGPSPAFSPAQIPSGPRISHSASAPTLVPPTGQPALLLASGSLDSVYLGKVPIQPPSLVRPPFGAGLPPTMPTPPHVKGVGTPSIPPKNISSQALSPSPLLAAPPPAVRPPSTAFLSKDTPLSAQNHPPLASLAPVASVLTAATPAQPAVPVPTSPLAAVKVEPSPGPQAPVMLNIPREVLLHELVATRQLIAAAQARESALLKELQRTGGLGAPALEKHPKEVDVDALKARLSMAEIDLRSERQRRIDAERVVEDVQRECKEPFVVPALLEAFIGISKMTSEALALR